MLSFSPMHPKRLRQAGMTLIELLVGLALFSVVSLAVGTVFSTGLNLSGLFFRNAATMEAVSDGMFQLTAIMPQVVKLNSCACSGTGGTAADCTWTSGAAWFDPVFDGGVATGSQIFEGEFEAGFGGLGAMADTTLTSYLNTNFPLARGCANNPYFNDATEDRGCRQLVRLTYTSPTLENVGSGTRSEPGSLQISIHDVAAPGQQTVFRIGDEGTAGAKAGVMTRSGLVRLSCGLDSPGGGQVGANFVLNLRTKVKQQSSENVNSDTYESWHPSGLNYSKGYLREARMKFNLQNLSVRGAYHWRMQSLRSCRYNGDSLGSVSVGSEACCSGAKSGTTCLGTCKRAGLAASEDAECCSEKISGGFCI